MSDKTTYVVKEIDKEIWVRFRGKAMLNGFKTASDCINMLINKYASEKQR